LLFALFFQSFISMQKNAMISDETIYFPAGYAYLKTGNFQIAPYDPPLIKEILALPLLILNPNYEKVTFNENIDRYDYNAVYFPNFLFKLNKNTGQLLLWARVMSTIISIIAGFIVYIWAKQLYGTKAGLFALFLYVFSTTILSFSWLANLETGLMAFILIALYSLWRYFKHPSTKNLIISGIALGLGISAKTIGIFLIPIFFIILLINRPPKSIKQVYKNIITFSALLIIASLTIFACYGFQVSTIASNVHSDGKEAALKTLPDIPILRYTIEEIPLPLSNYIIQLYNRFRASNIEWFDAYLLGEHSKKGWRHYYLIEMLIKAQIPLLVFISITALLYKKFSKKTKKYDSFLLVPILFIFIYLSLFNKVNAGIRYILSIFPFLFIWVSKIITIKIKKRSLLTYFIIIMCLWYIGSTLFISPYYISYFNEFIGGPKNGHNYLVDSDLDWGQDIIRLKNYMEENNIKSMRMNVIGLLDYHNIKHEELECGPTTGTIAVSASKLHGFMLENKECYSWLETHKPIKRIGYSIFIYNIT
ncbi:MAG: glycosyltransferase family 39 protein, partial [Candidatus Woesearchaeota archaeon]|nr:glycosyltransferase family 39 protein [Candidatus Woesearchaeota archaeon]